MHVIPPHEMSSQTRESRHPSVASDLDAAAFLLLSPGWEMEKNDPPSILMLWGLKNPTQQDCGLLLLTFRECSEN